LRLWQAAWNTSGNLFLWGESREPAIAHLGTLSAKNIEFSEYDASESGPRLHPFALPIESLVRDLKAMEIEASSVGTISLTLPTISDLPDRPPRYLQNDGGVFDSSNARPNARLGTWEAPAISLDTLDAIAFLTSFPSELPEGLRLDDSVRFWREASKLLLDLLTRGRFLPGLIHASSE